MEKQIRDQQPHQDTASTLHKLAEAYNNTGNIKEAINYYKLTLEMEQLIYKDQPDENIVETLNDLGNAYISIGETQLALEHYQRALVLEQQICENKSDPKIVKCLNNLARSYECLGKAEVAVELREQSFLMLKQIHKDQLDPSVAISLHNLGAAYLSLGQAEKAIVYLEQSLEMVDRIYESNSSSITEPIITYFYGNNYKPYSKIAVTLKHLGSAYRMTGNENKSEKNFLKAAEYEAKDHDPDYKIRGKIRKALDLCQLDDRNHFPLIENLIETNHSAFLDTLKIIPTTHFFGGYINDSLIDKLFNIQGEITGLFDEISREISLDLNLSTSEIITFTTY